MRMGIGAIELVIILLVLGVICMVVFRVLFGGRRGNVGGDVNLPHPKLKQCPGCGAPTATNADVCPQCGLRISA